MGLRDASTSKKRFSWNLNQTSTILVFSMSSNKINIVGKATFCICYNSLLKTFFFSLLCFCSFSWWTYILVSERKASSSACAKVSYPINAKIGQGGFFLDQFCTRCGNTKYQRLTENPQFAFSLRKWWQHILSCCNGPTTITNKPLAIRIMLLQQRFS